MCKGCAGGVSGHMTPTQLLNVTQLRFHQGLYDVQYIPLMVMPVE